MEEQEIQKSYYAVIPASVRYNNKIVDGAKLLYGEITALCNGKGYCWASNEYFSNLYNKDIRTIQRWFISLSKEEVIYILNKSGKRKIFISESKTEDYQEPEEDKVEDVKKESKKEIVKKEHKDKVVKYSQEDILLAELLLSKVLYNFPVYENRKVNIQEWAEDIRKLREIDKATTEQITFMIHWIHGGELIIPGKNKRQFEQHEFWSKNIMSAKKLRKQWFDNLVPQLQEEVKKQVKKSTVTQL